MAFTPPLSGGGLDLNSSNMGCARLGSGVAPLLGVFEEEVAVLIALVRRHRRAVGAAVCRAVDDEVLFLMVVIISLVIFYHKLIYPLFKYPAMARLSPQWQLVVKNRGCKLL